MPNTASRGLAEGRAPVKRVCINDSVIRLKYNMQELWIEHAWWTRRLIVSSIGELKDQNDVLKRLLKNQDDLGAGKIIEAVKKGDQASVDQFNKEWYRNADEIVTFLSAANPYWSKRELTDMFYFHLKLTTDEVVDRLKGDWVADINTVDKNETHLIHMGDNLTDGIVKQFPKKFNQ